MNTCKNCKFWDFKPSPGKEIISWSHDISEMNDCLNKKLADLKTPMVLTQDDAPDSGIMTSPDFGCNHFENKDSENSETKEQEFERRIYQLECDLHNHINED